MTRYLALACFALAALSLLSGGSRPAPTPPAVELDLVGLASGPTAAEDLALVSGLSAGLADALEWDGTPPPAGPAAPRIRGGLDVEELRVAAALGAGQGQTVGSRQPRVREAIGAFLDKRVGKSGKPWTPEQRAAHVAALREVAAAAAWAARSAWGE